MGLFDFLKRSQGTGAMDAPAAEPERAVIEGRIPDDLLLKHMLQELLPLSGV